MSSLKKEFLDLLKSDEEFRYAVAGLIGLEEVLRRLDRHESELVKLREDMNKLREDTNRLREDMNRGFELMERRISALGARWGIMTEEAFREGIKGLLEKELGLKVERWVGADSEGEVYGFPSQIEVDVSVHNGRIILIEVSSHVRRSDVAALKKKALVYEKITNNKPDRLLIVTPYVDEDAYKLAKELGIEIYTKV